MAITEMAALGGGRRAGGEADWQGCGGSVTTLSSSMPRVNETSLSSSGAGRKDGESQNEKSIASAFSASAPALWL